MPSFKRGTFTAGTAVLYGRSLITAEQMHQHLARGLELGTFPLGAGLALLGGKVRQPRG